MPVVRTIPVFADTVRMGRCRSERCGKRIFFATTVARGKSMPFSGEPVPLKITVDADSGRQVYHFDFEQSHFRDCKDAGRFSSSARRS